MLVKIRLGKGAAGSRPPVFRGDRRWTGKAYGAAGLKKVEKLRFDTRQPFRAMVTDSVSFSIRVAYGAEFLFTIDYLSWP